MLPEDKHAYVEKLQAEGRRVCMVGDGANYSPALSAAHVSVAMSSGSAVALSAWEARRYLPKVEEEQTKGTESPGQLQANRLHFGEQFSCCGHSHNDLLEGLTSTC